MARKFHEGMHVFSIGIGIFIGGFERGTDIVTGSAVDFLDALVLFTTADLSIDNVGEAEAVGFTVTANGENELFNIEAGGGNGTEGKRGIVVGKEGKHGGLLFLGFEKGTNVGLGFIQGAEGFRMVGSVYINIGAILVDKPTTGFNAAEIFRAAFFLFPGEQKQVAIMTVELDGGIFHRWLLLDLRGEPFAPDSLNLP